VLRINAIEIRENLDGVLQEIIDCFDPSVSPFGGEKI